MAFGWERVTNTTTRKFLREKEPAVFRNRKLLAMVKDRGRVSYDNAGDGFRWEVQFKLPQMIAFGDMQTLSFPQQQLWKSANLDYRGYAIPDSMSKGEFLKNRSTEALVQVWSGRTERMTNSISEQFGNEFYVDGNAAGFEDAIHGIESFLGYSGAATNGFVATPSDTYAGLSTALGAVSGTWDESGGATTWPLGEGSADFDYWSPTIVDYEDTAWSTGTDTWPNTAREAIAFMVIFCGKNKSMDSRLDLIILENNLYRQLISALDANERTTVKRGDGKNGVYSLGFTDVVNLNGVDVTYEFGVPPTKGYAFNIDKMELMSQQSQLFIPEGPTWVPGSQAWVYSIDFYGNLKFESPRYFGLFDDVT